jgi:hypothetical protein
MVIPASTAVPTPLTRSIIVGSFIGAPLQNPLCSSTKFYPDARQAGHREFSYTNARAIKHVARSDVVISLREMSALALRAESAIKSYKPQAGCRALRSIDCASSKGAARYSLPGRAIGSGIREDHHAERDDDNVGATPLGSPADSAAQSIRGRPRRAASGIATF